MKKETAERLVDDFETDAESGYYDKHA